MNKRFLSVVVLLGISSAASAQKSYVQSTQTPSSDASRGVRVTLLKPILDLDAKVSFDGKSLSVSDSVDEVFGFSLGYAALPIQELGWVANIAYFNLKNNNESNAMVRADANLAYTFNGVFNVKGGLNISKVTGGVGASDVRPGLGIQMGTGIQLNSNFGIDLGYVIMNQTADIGGVDVQYKLSGIEIGLNGTF